MKAYIWGWLFTGKGTQSVEGKSPHSGVVIGGLICVQETLIAGAASSVRLQNVMMLDLNNVYADPKKDLKIKGIELNSLFYMFSPKYTSTINLSTFFRF